MRLQLLALLLLVGVHAWRRRQLGSTVGPVKAPSGPPPAPPPINSSTAPLNKPSPSPSIPGNGSVSSSAAPIASILPFSSNYNSAPPRTRFFRHRTTTSTAKPPIKATTNPIYSDFVIAKMFDSNDKIEFVLLAWFIIIFFFLVLCCCILFLTRCVYRRKMVNDMKDIREAQEGRRGYYVDDGAHGAKKVQPPPISPPLTDQTEYNLVAAVLADYDKGRLFLNRLLIYFFPLLKFDSK
ncbi:unnamed protein product [Caenorhabditis auriculariae]|uniref:Uncharacterized protein n=1 Tax=Caenorhabditis auriculariae TaxID=2777116 RepID=A0A8S1HTB6_9PELO|nr:unnamed protein product [Caenorhabditis auriculariae]